MGLHHAGRKLAQLRIGFHALGLPLSHSCVTHSAGPVYLLGDCFDALTEGHFIGIEEFEVGLFIARLDDSIGQLKSALTPFQPVFGDSHPCPRRLTMLS